MRDIAVFSGSAHRSLAAEVCAELGTDLRPVRTTRFANDCLEVQLQANCRERDMRWTNSPPMMRGSRRWWNLKYFCGYTFEDIAAQRGTSKKTVQRDWEKARVILFGQLTDVS